MTGTVKPTRPTAVRRPVWPRILVGGLALWVAAVAVTFVTANPNLIPTVVLLGSFLVPVTFVAWAWERRATGELTPSLILTAFTAGGVLGVCAASVLEAYLLDPSPWLFLGVGLIEEAAKLAALAVFTRHLVVRSVRDGMILGATVGFGFAAFESAGYAFTALFTVDGLSLVQVVETEVLRGVLAPFGHGLWTAILGGVFFASWRAGRFALTVRLVLTYLGVSLLHALWDWVHDIALVLTRLLTEPGYAPTPYGWLEVPTQTQVNLFTALQWGGWALISASGVAWLVTMWRHANNHQKGTLT